MREWIPTRASARGRLVLAALEAFGRRGYHGVGVAELADDPWVWLPREVSPGYHDELVAACRAAGFSPDARHSATSIDSQLAMVACGLGVTLAPHTSTARAPAGSAVLPLRRRFDLIELSIVRRAQAPGPLVEHFVDCARYASAAGSSSAVL